MWLRPREGAKLIAWASGQPAAARSSGLGREVPLRARLGVHAMGGQMQPDRDADHQGPQKWAAPQWWRDEVS